MKNKHLEETEIVEEMRSLALRSFHRGGIWIKEYLEYILWVDRPKEEIISMLNNLIEEIEK